MIQSPSISSTINDHDGSLLQNLESNDSTSFDLVTSSQYFQNTRLYFSKPSFRNQTFKDKEPHPEEITDESKRSSSEEEYDVSMSESMEKSNGDLRAKNYKEEVILMQEQSKYRNTIKPEIGNDHQLSNIIYRPQPINSRFYQEARYKTELCLHYRERNRCPHGAQCLFAHGLEELRPYSGRHPKHKTKICKSFHDYGFCNYGYRCSYIHSESPRTIDYIKNLNRRAQIVKRKQLYHLLFRNNENQTSDKSVVSNYNTNTL